MKASLEELYQRPGVLDQANRSNDFHRRYEQAGTQEALQTLSSFATTEALQAHLDTLHEPHANERAAYLLGFLPARLLIDNYGDSTAIWTLANASAFQAEPIAEQLGQRGYDSDLLLRARTLCQIENEISYPLHQPLLHYKTMNQIIHEELQKIDLPAVLQACAKPTTPMKPRHARKYGLIPLRHNNHEVRSSRVDHWEGKTAIQEQEGTTSAFTMWLDAPVGFAFTYKGVPQALVAFSARSDKELLVRQLQGVNRVVRDEKTRQTIKTSSPWSLSWFEDWQKMLLEIAEQLSKPLGMNRLGLVSAKEVTSSYYYLADPSQATKAYDNVAKRLGFQKGDDGNWHTSTQ